jgi:biotin transport system substrate-specific component
MLRTIEQTRDTTLLQRAAGIAVFTLLTIVGARISLEIGAVPLTLQTLMVFLAGMVLGSRDGALSQVLYVGLIVIGLPLDARGLGPAVFASPTWGYLVGFIPCAFVAGWLVEHSGNRIWQRVVAGLIGSMFSLIPGMIVAKFVKEVPWEIAVNTYLFAFIGVEIAKAIVAGALTEGARLTLLRLLNPTL